MNAIICICSAEYINYYKVLYASLRKHAPSTKQILYHIGEVKESFDIKVDITKWFNETIYPETLNKICSLRARVVLDAFNRGFEKVLFVGAKMEFYSDLSYVFNALDYDDVLATPHITEPLPEDGKFPSNAAVCFTGHLSTDFIAFRKSDPTRRFLAWQDEIMKTQCKTTHQVYLDQSWLNFLPFFVDKVDICKYMGFNFAYWRLHQGKVIKGTEFEEFPYMLEGTDNEWSEPLVCFQFSGLPLDNPKKISTHQNRWEANGEFLDFLTNYAERVKNAT